MCTFWGYQSFTKQQQTDKQAVTLTEPVVFFLPSSVEWSNSDTFSVWRCLWYAHNSVSNESEHARVLYFFLHMQVHTPVCWGDITDTQTTHEHLVVDKSCHC